MGDIKGLISSDHSESFAEIKKVLLHMIKLINILRSDKTEFYSDTDLSKLIMLEEIILITTVNELDRYKLMEEIYNEIQE